MTQPWGTLKPFNGWLEHFKKRFGLRQTRTVGEAGDVPITTIKAWMESLPEIFQGYSADDIWNMDESGLFFKALPDTGLGNKLKSVKANERNTVTFFVSSSRFKVCQGMLTCCYWKE